MDTSKLITAVVWATLIVVLYELWKNVGSGSQLGGGTLAEVQNGLTEIASNWTNPKTNPTVQMMYTDSENIDAPVPNAAAFAY